MRKHGCCLFFICMLANGIFAQQIISITTPEIISPPNPEPSVKKLNVAEIKIVGNAKTKSYIIAREVQFKVGDSLRLDQFDEQLHTARDQVYNLNLFTEVFIEPTQIVGSDVFITVKVLERWYIYPTPQFQLVDRNFNEWIKVYKASLDRVNYGAKFVHYNLSGRKDELRLILATFLTENGYTCEQAAKFDVAHEKISIYEYDVILLDITLPGGNGLDLIHTVKKKRLKTGIIVVSAKNSLDDKISGLDLGADDYMTKPFPLSELNSRIKAVLRRGQFEGTK